MVKIKRIEIYLENGESFTISDYDLKRLQALDATINMLDRARQAYNQLKEIFEKEQKKQ